MAMMIGEDIVDACYVGSELASGCEGALPPVKVLIRYTSTDDLTLLTPHAVGGTASITDNGDGTYDLWSYDACEFIALNDDVNDTATLNITKAEVIKGGTLKYFVSGGESTPPSATFAIMLNMIEFVWNGDSNINDMNSAFTYCESLVTLDLTEMNMSKVTNMTATFADCISLVSLDLSSWDTSGVTDMNGLFRNCNSLTSVDVSGFDTSKVTDMKHMFWYCESLTSIDLSSFDTSSVVNMYGMLRRCLLLPSVNLSGFDTSKVTDMKHMFSYSGLICITNLDTTNVTEKDYMFQDCTSLVQPDGWNADAGLYTGACADLTDGDGADWVNANACP